jgi:predicted amidophosphoribosyltransferase
VRCLLCQRTDPPFERAVAYGSYEGELRDLIHLLKFQQVRRRPRFWDACWPTRLQTWNG